MVEVSPEVVRNRIATLYAVVEDLQTAKDRMDDARRAQLGSWSQLPTVHRAQEPVYSTLLDLTSRLTDLVEMAEGMSENLSLALENLSEADSASQDDLDTIDEILEGIQQNSGGPAGFGPRPMIV
jgi:phytoene/squalene synthetase